MSLKTEMLERYGIDDAPAAEITGVKKRRRPNLKYGMKVTDTVNSATLDLTGAELIAALSGGDSGALVTGITAFAGGGQSSATVLTGRFNNVTTVATAADSVKLPAAAAGLVVVVRNGAANALAVFPATGDAINALSANASITVPTLGTMTFTAINATTWYSSIGVTEAAQTITGAKSFTTNVTAIGAIGALRTAGVLGGSLSAESVTADKGSVALQTADNAGNTVTIIKSQAQAAARTYNILDWSTKASEDTECSLAGIKVVADTTNRPGALGCLLYATGNNKLYVCTAASATAATWTIVGTQS